MGDPLRVELVAMSLGAWLGEEALTIRVRLEDGREVEVQLPRDSPEVAELLEALGRVTTSALSPLGQSGVVLTGLAPPVEFEDEDE